MLILKSFFHAKHARTWNRFCNEEVFLQSRNITAGYTFCKQTPTSAQVWSKHFNQDVQNPYPSNMQHDFNIQAKQKHSREIVQNVRRCLGRILVHSFLAIVWSWFKCSKTQTCKPKPIFQIFFLQTRLTNKLNGRHFSEPMQVRKQQRECDNFFLVLLQIFMCKVLHFSKANAYNSLEITPIQHG